MEDKKAELFRSAKELFAEKGFKDTNVADITKHAGMSVGSFYNYYPSKEKLFMEIFLAENAALKQKMLAAIDPADGPGEMVRKMLAMNLAGMRADKILGQWYDRDVFSRIERLFREENGIDAVQFLYGDTEQMVRRWQADGKMRSDLSSRMIMAIFAALINIDTHKEEIGLEFFPELVDHMTEYVMRGLTETNTPTGNATERSREND